jgi:hypothetical protein
MGKSGNDTPSPALPCVMPSVSRGISFAFCAVVAFQQGILRPSSDSLRRLRMTRVIPSEVEGSHAVCAVGEFGRA